MDPLLLRFIAAQLLKAFGLWALVLVGFAIKAEFRNRRKIERDC